ncbi:hypothetical protein PC115_g12497 [Phytophthora cactorum]|uniref:Uncharacterized protein n=1 Tax=Phytophthora cactorum TaxID=29920 RepID=A0A8T1BVY9_9STRA|nr:hypothetical protein PC115_g12497 [Phytophthora cactorum]
MRWVEWYVMDRMPVSYCERPLVCKNAKMQPISAATLQKFLDAPYGHVREVIATTLPDKFVIALDALTTAFCPLGDEEHLSAQSLFDLIADTLSTYNRPRRFQLPVNDFLADKELLLAKIHALMKHLNTIKCRAALRKVTPLAPVLRSVTRWSSTFNMVERGEESEHVEELLETLMDLNEVTKALQDSTLTKSGIIKIISGSCLTTREQEAYKAFKRPATNGTVEETSRSFLAPVFQKALEPRTSYIPLA